MALPNLADIPKTVGKMLTRLGNIEKKVEGFAKDSAKGVASAATTAAGTAVKPVMKAVSKVANEVGAVKKWTTGKIADVVKMVGRLTQRVAQLEQSVNPLRPLSAQVGLLTTHEARLKNIENAVGRMPDHNSKVAKDIQELKNAIKQLDKRLDALKRAS